MKYLPILILTFALFVCFKQSKRDYSYVYMEHSPQFSLEDPTKLIRNVIIYSDTFELQVRRCAKFIVTTKDFQRIVRAIQNCPHVRKVDSSYINYYNLIVSNVKAKSYFSATNSPDVTGLFDSIVSVVENLHSKKELKESFDEIKSEFR